MHCRLKVLAAERDLNQSDLVRDLGLGSHTVSKLWNNTFKRVDRETVETLLNYFDCSLADLFVDKEVKA